jgi:hypothetical protein
MEESIRGQVLEPFFTTKPADRGTGLGLSVVHDLVLRAGGRTMVESAPGQGTTVRLILPIIGLPAEQPGVQNVAPAMGGVPGYGRSRLPEGLAAKRWSDGAGQEG